MTTKKLHIAGIEIDLVRKDIKNIHLAVYPPDGRVRIAAPERMEDDSIRLFAISRLPWIKKNRKKFASQSRETLREYLEGESHYYQGHRYLLHLIEHTGNNRVHIRNKKYLDLYVKPGASRDQKERALREWYRRELKKQIPPLLAKWEAILGVRAAGWGVKQMRTKWGACNTHARRIWLNLELAKKPSACLEYIIAHELVHLLERKHGERFMALMGRAMPDWRGKRDLLNSYPVGRGDWGY
ncbi:MAG: M48 family metallopeptidase [Saprospirales bacterium]|nr:M48 family metallopeptidase [Saprospirales bacterium]